MRSADGIAVAAGGQSGGQQRIEVPCNSGDLFVIEDPDSGQISVAIEARELLDRQAPRIRSRRGMKAELALDAA